MGGGKVALKRAKKLLEHGAKVTVISPELDAGFDKLEEDFRLVKRKYKKGDCKDFFFAVIATDSGEVNQKVAKEMRNHNILYNLADNPDACSTVMPGVVHENGFTVSLTTGGSSPILTKFVLKQIKAMIETLDGDMLEQLAEERKEILKSDADKKEKKQLLKKSVADALSGWKFNNGKNKKN